jgi:hypothetical protein
VANEEAPPITGLDRSVPSVGRIYDYLIGGKDNYEADRKAADDLKRIIPDVAEVARENRAFLGRAARYLSEEVGIRQFIDVGTGLPTQGHVHQVVDPESHIVYVDNDPVVLAHARALLPRSGTAKVIEGDLRRPKSILDHPDTLALIDFDKPVAVVLAAMLHFVTDEEDPAGIVTTFRERMAPGSHIVISHDTRTGPALEDVENVERIYQKANAPLLFRTAEEIQSYFDGFDMVEPGLTYVSQWRPDGPGVATDKKWIMGGVGRISS